MRRSGPSAALSDCLRAAVAQGDVPAVAAAVVEPDGLAYLGACGKRDVARNLDAAPDTIFRLASMTKPITSLAAMMLVDDGLLALDAPAAAYLPDFVPPPVLAGWSDTGGRTRPAERDITVRHLLTNTSGLAYPSFYPALVRAVSTGTAAPDLPLLHDPGEEWTYGPGTAVLGRLVAAVAGETLDAFCQRRIFDPLGMVDTGYAVPASASDRVATISRRRSNGEIEERPNPPVIQSKGRGDDGLFGTAGDYAAFVQLILNEGRRGASRLVRPDTIRQMATNQVGSLVVREVSAPAFAAPFPLGAGKDRFGFGFQIETEPSAPDRRSPGSLSWAGIFNTHFWIDPRRRVGGVVLMQLLPANDHGAVRLLHEFERQVYARAHVYDPDRTPNVNTVSDA